MPTNKLALILMDSEAHRELRQIYEQPWKRSLHTQLLQKLTEDKCPLVVFDAFFDTEGNKDEDAELAEAMRRQGHVVLASKVGSGSLPQTDIALAGAPIKLFLDAAAGYGFGAADGLGKGTARRHWPFPAAEDGEFVSLPWAAARLAGARFDGEPQYQWLRYYGNKGPWVPISYNFALKMSTNYFRDKIVFIGRAPQTPTPDDERDKFSTPYTRWNQKAVGGVEILATEFLNLMNRDWLRRPPWGIELCVFVVLGVLLGGGLSRVRPLAALGVGVTTVLAVTIAAASLTHFTNYWFPWLVIICGQVPCAVVFALARRSKPIEVTTTIILSPAQTSSPEASAQVAEAIVAPDAPDYELFHPPFGHGAYGKVWLARNAIGQWQALKAVYLAKFGTNAHPYEREFSGIRRFKPISHKHPGLLRVDFVSKKKSSGYFYYVMELGDSLQPGWEENPSTYVPRDLARVRSQAEGRRLPALECVRILISVSEAVEFLHQQGFTHRDIKPQNIIFVNDQPKLGDVGLVADIRPQGETGTYIGTPGYMPPAGDKSVGTPQADIYGLGMLLYVILTGREADFFPTLATTLLETANPPDFQRVNSIVLRACDPDLTRRFASAGAMGSALREAEAALTVPDNANRL
jgi:CHASE2 domain-containing sensor protein